MHTPLADVPLPPAGPLTIDPELATEALRVALQLLIDKGGIQEERDEAMATIGQALATVRAA